MSCENDFTRRKNKGKRDPDLTLQVHTKPSGWSMDDAAWFARHPRRRYRVRKRFLNEWFTTEDNDPTLDLVAICQPEKGFRFRLPFALTTDTPAAVAGAARLLREARKNDAAARVFFDMVKQRNPTSKCGELWAQINRYMNEAHLH
jgi:hypothetical protein